ncbi:MAG: DUF4445 domain-containing protein [Clostridia bacterium]|nr:DUF4445 domain-containing protein [Clostridia bacterium]
MAELTIFQQGRTMVVPFEGTPVLDEVLVAAGVQTPHPCGGRGSCGKCVVTLSGAVSEPNAAEQKAGVRLSCQAVLFGDAQVILPDAAEDSQIETETGEQPEELCPMTGDYGAAVDIGTTTIAVKVYDLHTGACIGTAAELNPQGAVAADVMGRIEAAMKGELQRMQNQVTEAIDRLLKKACAVCPDAMVVTGNTTMLYLLTGKDPTCLSRAPFVADTLFDTEQEICGIRTYLPACMNAFVGADITCAVLASGMCNGEETALLCDIGTNGEMALWKDGKLYVTSTAAGPAFEGAGISCGCGSVRGAIDKVWLEDDELKVHTLGDVPAVGVCGSGLLDAVAAGLALEAIEETGAMDDDLELSNGIALEPKDIRAVQLAKAAIAAGMQTMLEEANVPVEEVKTLYIAGGFGSHLRVESAVAIGLLPEELADRTCVLGNAALSGAARALLNQNERQLLSAIAAGSSHVNLGGNPRFNENYVDNMFFGDDF